MVRKSAAIRAFIALLEDSYGSSLALMAAAPVGHTREVLLALPGVGPETADAILLYALGQPVMVVDEYLRRVVTRHSLIDEAARYPAVQALALEAFAGDAPQTLLAHYNEFHALIVMVGKTHCGGVPMCAGCPLNRPAFYPPATPRSGPAHAQGRQQQGAAVNERTLYVASWQCRQAPRLPRSRRGTRERVAA